jgi:hypothetical protein
VNTRNLGFLRNTMELLILCIIAILTIIESDKDQKRKRLIATLKDFYRTKPTGLSDSDFTAYCMWLLNPGLYYKEIQYAEGSRGDIQIISHLSPEPKTAIRCVNREWVCEEDVIRCQRGCIRNNCEKAMILTTGLVSPGVKTYARRLDVAIYQRSFIDQLLQASRMEFLKRGADV